MFVFDGGAPALKRQTVLGRKQRREGRREDATRTAGRLLAVQMKKRGEEEEERRKRDRERAREGRPVGGEDEVLPDEREMVYVGELGMSAQERTATRKFHKKDAYHLPELTNGIEGMGQPNDPRIMSAEELQEYARQFNTGEDVNLYDFSKIDFNGDFFMSLPAGDRYNILNAARLRSRLRMGLSKEQLEEMFPDRMAFSKFQIERVRERNELTQRLMNLSGMNDDIPGVGAGRIAGESGREYVLVKNEGVEGGWALGVVSTDKTVGEREKPIDVDALHQKIMENQEVYESSEDEFEDVPVEGLNRLPKAKSSTQNLTYEDFRTQEIESQKRKLHAAARGTISRNGEHIRQGRQASSEENPLFMDSDHIPGNGYVLGEEDEQMNRALRVSRVDVQELESELAEDEHLNRAIAMSLQKNHHHESESDDDANFEDVVMPEYEQRAVADPKPIANTSGRMVAHIVNNRANAAVPKRRAVSVSSDSDMDLQSTLAKARKEKAPGKKRQPAPVALNSKNAYDGPLPFEKLQFSTSIFAKKSHESAKDIEMDDEAADEKDLEGGFEREALEAPKPIPPWLVRNDDVRDQVQEQQKIDRELNAEDREQRLQEERAWRKELAPIEIDSSDKESDVEILDAPPRRTSLETMNDVAEDVRVDPPVSEIPDDRPPSVEPVLIANANQRPGLEEEDDVVDWSESDYGDTKINNAHVVESTNERAVTPTERGSREIDFRKVDSPIQDVDRQTSQAKSPFPQIEDSYSVDGHSQSLDDVPERPGLPEVTISGQADLVNDADFDDFSDPDDEELLAQLAIEAEEHARFASTLNNKSAQENQETYERELRALRSQQQKDRRDADEVTHIMITECQALLRLFGLPYITAPMEAEAQCAELVRLGLVDGIVTDDSDIFLFGGTRVYKNMFNSNKFVECYLCADLEKELSLSRNQLISIAHLLGSDYTEGLPGVGPVTAVEILSEFPSQNGLQEFKDWWSLVQLSNIPLSNEKTTFRKKFRRSQGTKLFLPPTFPSPAVTEAYLKPNVDSTPEPFQWGVPDLDRLREFLMATIGWSQERTDEVLVPVIRDMNRRDNEGTQSNITRFFNGAVGVGARANASGKRDPGSKRMRDAVGKLKAKKSGSVMIDGNSATFAGGAAAWAEKEAKEAQKGKGRRKKRFAVEVSVNPDDAVEQDGNNAAEVDTDNESSSYEGDSENTPTNGSQQEARKIGSQVKRKRTKA